MNWFSIYVTLRPQLSHATQKLLYQFTRAMASNHDYHLIPAVKKELSRNTGGFHCEFVKPLERNNLQSECPVCLQIIRDPHQVTCCGKKYCYTCIEYIETSGRPCPNCNTKDIVSFPDVGLQQKLYALKVRCSHQKDGCEWTGELEQLDEHLNTNPLQEKQLEGCPFAEINCLYNCGDKWQRQYIQSHKNECSKRLFGCEHCHHYVSTFDDVTNNHWPVCGSIPVPCPNECGSILQRQNKDSHVADECPLTTINCDFHHVGCAVKLPRQDMPEHLRENLLTHISLLATSHAKQQDDLAEHKTEINKQKNEIVEAKTQIATLVDENKALQIKNTNLEHNHLSLATNFNRVQIQLTGEGQALKEENIQLRKELSVLTKQTRARRSVDASPRTTIPLTPPVLAMTNFSQRKKSLDTWYSAPVYSHGQGYKLCLGVYPNIPNKHISVFIHFMRGGFDDSLLWPFRGVIWFRLLDQVKHEDHRVQKVVFDDTVETRVRSRVTEKERADKGLGKGTFMAHAELDSRYLQANTLLFQIYRVELA